jgi:guanylate kinase
MKNLLIVLSGPSGVGKGTIVNRLAKSGNFATSVSCTTRAPREGEKEGVSYFFVSKDRFMEMIQKGELLEYSNHFENYYGTPKAFVEEQLRKKDVILEIEVNGALQIKSVYPQAVLIMIVPPNKEELAKRLRGRGTESEQLICERLARLDYELSKQDQYDEVVVNDDIERAVAQIQQIIAMRKGDRA